MCIFPLVVGGMTLFHPGGNGKGASKLRGLGKAKEVVVEFDDRVDCCIYILPCGRLRGADIEAMQQLSQVRNISDYIAYLEYFHCVVFTRDCLFL